MKTSLVILILAILSLSFVSADVIMPGYFGMEIENVMTNINDFPDYVFISLGQIPSMCEIKVIESDGIIPGAYKFCSPSVYAIKKADFDPQQVIIYNENEYITEKNRSEYLKSVNAIEVISGIETYTEIPITSTQKEIVNYYTIDLDKVKTSPDNQEIKRSYLIYFYIAIPIAALIIIISIIISRRRK